MFAISETLCRADHPSSPMAMDGYNTCRVERSGTEKGGGGLCLLYRDSLTASEWLPSVPSHLQYIQKERQWLLISSNTEKIAFLHIYLACQSFKSDAFLTWNEDLLSLVTKEAIMLKKQGFVVLSLGDYNTRVGQLPGLEGNTPDTNGNTPMFMTFISEVNLLIINTLPISKGVFTRFMDESGRPGTRSLLDYGLIDADRGHKVSSFVIDHEARFACGSDHALLECTLEVGAERKMTWAFQEALQYEIKDSTNFNGYKTCLDIHVSDIPLHTFSELSLDQMLPHISESIHKSATKSLGIKVKKRIRNKKIPKDILSKIRLKNELSCSLAQAHHTSDDHELARMKAALTDLKGEIKDMIINVKLKQRNHLRSRVLAADPTRRRFWRFLKHQSKAAGSITALKDTSDQMVFKQDEIEDCVIGHFEKIFQGKRCPVYPMDAPVSQVDLAIQEIDDILCQEAPQFAPDYFEKKVCSPYSFSELDETLQNLPNNKAAGYDRIPNELLKNSSYKFKQYILAFLNKIMEEGAVPEALNVGKCVLIYKVLSKPQQNLLYNIKPTLTVVGLIEIDFAHPLHPRSRHVNKNICILGRRQSTAVKLPPYYHPFQLAPLGDC